jgi:hypothetical protein
MQLTLSSPQGLRHAPARPVPLRSLAVPWRDSASAQLDALAAVDRRRSGAGARLLQLAALGVAFLGVLALTWRAPPVQPPARAMAAQVPVGVMGAALSARPSTPVEPAADVRRAAAAERVAQPVMLLAAQDRHVARPAESSRKASTVAKARPSAADPAARRALLQLERVPQDVEHGEGAPRSPVVEEPPRLQTAAAAPDTLRSVREVCAGAGGFIGEQFCRSRECRKPEQQGDPVCVRLRDIEEARLRSAAER